MMALNESMKTTFVIVTHEMEVAAQMKKRLCSVTVIWFSRRTIQRQQQGNGAKRPFVPVWGPGSCGGGR